MSVLYLCLHFYGSLVLVVQNLLLLVSRQDSPPTLFSLQSSSNTREAEWYYISPFSLFLNSLVFRRLSVSNLYLTRGRLRTVEQVYVGLTRVNTEVLFRTGVVDLQVTVRVSQSFDDPYQLWW